MRSGRWLAIIVATLVWSIGLWFGLLSMNIDRTVAIATIGIGLIIAVYATAGFSGAPDIATSGFRGSLIGLGAAVLALLAYWFTDIDALVVGAAPFAAGIGGTFALHPSDDRLRDAVRAVAVGVVTVILVLVYRIDPTVYGLVAPLLSFPALGIADRIYDRGREVVAETAAD